MPTMNGWNVMKELSNRGRTFPVVVMTAAQDAARWAADVHADGYLTKLFDLTELLSSVVRHGSAG